MADERREGRVRHLAGAADLELVGMPPSVRSRLGLQARALCGHCAPKGHVALLECGIAGRVTVSERGIVFRHCKKK